MIIHKGKAVMRSFRKKKKKKKTIWRKKRVCWHLKNNVAEKRWGKVADHMAVIVT